MKFSEILAKNGRPLSLKAGEYLFRQGDQDRSVYLLQNGLLKAYYLSHDGKENIKSFLLPGDTIGSLKGIMGKDGCSFSLMCLEDSELISIEFEKIYSQSAEDVELASDVVNFLLAFGIKKENREYELLCLSPEARYQRLCENAPQLLEQVTQNEIARYLGVTPVGLSRIKKRVQTS